MVIDYAHARGAAQLIEKLVELKPADGREAVAVDIDALIAVDDALRRPGFQPRHQQRVKIGHVTFEKGEGIQRKHHAEAEGGVGRILLEDTNPPRRKAALDQQREQKPGRPSTNDVNLHGTVRSYLSATDNTHHEGHEGHEGFGNFRSETLRLCGRYSETDQCAKRTLRKLPLIRTLRLSAFARDIPIGFILILRPLRFRSS